MDRKEVLKFKARKLTHAPHRRDGHLLNDLVHMLDSVVKHHRRDIDVPNDPVYLISSVKSIGSQR